VYCVIVLTCLSIHVSVSNTDYYYAIVIVQFEPDTIKGHMSQQINAFMVFTISFDGCVFALLL